MEYLESHRRPGAAEPARAELIADGGKQRRFRSPAFATPLAITIVLLAMWQVASTRGFIDDLHFPAPTTIASATWRALVAGDLLADMAATTGRILWAVFIGGLLGMAFGVAMGLSDRLRRAIDPFVGAMHPLPKIAVLPLMMVVFGIGDLSLIVVIAAGAFFPMLINTMAGVSQIDPIHIEVARLHKAKRGLVLRRVVVPAAAPSVLAGLRLSLNTALLIAIAVEMVAADSGLGAMIWMSWTTFRIENIYVAILATVVFGLGVNFLISMITNYWVPWQRKDPS
jgi:ABC-type nitrate/sulfonate/bicarbonate transport system permease component